MSPRERAANAVGMLPIDGGDVLMDRLADWCKDPDAFMRLIVDVVLDEIPTVGDAALGNRLQGLSHFHDDQREALRDMIDAIKRGEG